MIAETHYFSGLAGVDELICQTTGLARVCKEQIKIELLADSSGVKLKCLQMEGGRKINTIISNDIKIALVHVETVLIHRRAQLMIVRTAM